MSPSLLLPSSFSSFHCRLNHIPSPSSRSHSPSSLLHPRLPTRITIALVTMFAVATQRPPCPHTRLHYNSTCSLSLSPITPPSPPLLLLHLDHPPRAHHVFTAILASPSPLSRPRFPNHASLLVTVFMSPLPPQLPYHGILISSPAPVSHLAILVVSLIPVLLYLPHPRPRHVATLIFPPFTYSGIIK
ncbi:hypothetical protein BOTBODRAFT_173089 [Botryobasidium botryosum FD-172 SS1]|uniref:Uncharacterized protein n=1 Tax=Botryobasidium botryosum (strain FD-172 SS1) TaxID=930990 RepID=A0A067MLE2_BOTB1|nr:hypothetical protein BOTBODRAFT_173089 [Botryobasidium botryosum FD-172 SS1]